MKLAAAVVMLAALTVGCSASGSTDDRGSAQDRATSAPAPRYPSGTTVTGRLPASVMDAAFTDQDGHTVRLSDLTGKVVVIQDSMTLCQELCPIDTSTFVAAAQQYAASSGSADVVFLTVTVDPQRDTPAQLAAYRRQYVGAPGNLPSWRLLTGSAQDVAALWKTLGVYVHRVPQDEEVDNWRTGEPLTYDVQHSDQVFFLDATGRERYLLDGLPSLGSNPIPATLERFMTAEGHRNETRKKGWTAPQALGVLAWLTGTSTGTRS